MPSESLERLALKRQKLAEQRSQRQLAENGRLSRNSHNATSPSFHPDALVGIGDAQNGFSCNTQTVSEGRKKETKVEPRNGLDCPRHPLVTVFHEKKKSEKHKDEEPDWFTNDRDDGGLETNGLEQKPSKTDRKR